MAVAVDEKSNTITNNNNNNENHYYPDYDATARTIIRGWLLMTSPFAVLAWYCTQSILLVIGTFAFTPILVILQGAFWIVRYRLFYGNCPHPLSTAHGVVVVHPESRRDHHHHNDNNDNSSSSSSSNEASSSHIHNKVEGCNCIAGRRWRMPSICTETSDDRSILQKASEEPPLRLLVIGDSLAVGVGCTNSCTPVLPEIIARTLSKSMGGRAVFWTSHGEPGASTGWVARELERGVQTGDVVQGDGNSSSMNNKKHEESPLIHRGGNSSGDSLSDDTTDDDSSSYSSSEEEEESLFSDDMGDTTDEEEGLYDFQDWRERLREHKKRFDPDCALFGPYDVVVIFTGPNDLKSIFFPFLLTGEDAKFRKQAQERGGFHMELKRVLDVLSERMKLRIRISINQIHQSVERALPENIKERIHLPPSSSSSSLSSSSQSATTEKTDLETTATTTTVNNNNAEISSSSISSETIRQQDDHHHHHHRPVVVLPGMPAEALPIFRAVPIRWTAIPMVSLMDSYKRAFAKSHPDDIIFVNDPKIHEIAEFESQKGLFWQQRLEEDTILNIRHVKRSTCDNIFTGMSKFYYNNTTNNNNNNNNRKRRRNVNKIIPQHNPPVPPLSDLPGIPGNKVFTADGIHPNEEGYDFWGRHIAHCIIKQLRTNNLANQNKEGNSIVVQ